MKLCIASVIIVAASLSREVPLNYDWRMGEG